MSNHLESADLHSRPTTPLDIDLAHLSSVIITSSAEDTESGSLVPDPELESEPLDPGHTIPQEDDPSGTETATEPTTQAFPSIPLPYHDGDGTYFAYPHSVGGSQSSVANNTVEPLPPDLASADISIAADRSFVETSSGPAARELKRRYDQRLGVGVSVRSPFAITAFVNQHGKQMYRVGHRDMSAPAAQADEAEDQIRQSKRSTTATIDSDMGASEGTRRSKRPSRMSVHALPHMFRNGSTSSSRPQTAAVVAGPNNSGVGPRKLRKTRSIPDDMRPKRDSVGRGHSNSVTSADISAFNATGSLSPEYNPSASASGSSLGVIRRKDMFADAMDWNPSSRLDSSSSSGTGTDDDMFLTNPFGQGVSFVSPSRRTGVATRSNGRRQSPPRHLRLMQSFESGLTARQTEAFDDGKGERITSMSSFASSTIDGHRYDHDYRDLARPPSAIKLRESYVATSPPPPTLPEEQEKESETDGSVVSTSDSTLPGDSASDDAGGFEPNTVTAMHSRFSNEVFDVLQTYRGIPTIDTFADDAEDTTVIRLSLASEDRAVPRDDPRFVIWGEIRHMERDDISTLSQESSVDLSSSTRSRSASRKRSQKGKGRLSDAASNVQEQVGKGRVLLAATIERWIAQLTSDLDYDQLLDFFLTYRTYISSVDLCDLLIARFHWALSEPKSQQDERVRRIVRVRTFVAFRYWILTFFTVDFLPNRDLRLLVASWLNSLIRDPILKKHNDGLSIVRKLRKVVQDCKKAHAKLPPKPKSAKQTPKDEKDEKLFGEMFAEATRKNAQEEDDSDLDLDFVLQDLSSDARDSANAHLSTVHLGGGFSPTSRVSTIPLSSLAILQRTEPMPISESDAIAGPMIPPPGMNLPLHHGALSRAFVKTMGRLGRWKRVLNNRAATRIPVDSCTDVSAFDPDMSGSRDSLNGNDDMDRFWTGSGTGRSPFSNYSLSPPATSPSRPASRRHSRATRASMSVSTAYSKSPRAGHAALPRSPPTMTHALSPQSVRTASSHPSVSATSTVVEGLDETADRQDRPPSYASTTSVVSVSSPTAPPGLEITRGEGSANAASDADSVAEPDRASIARTSSTDSFGRPLSTAPPFEAPFRFDVVSIDELDFSDASSDAGPSAPPGLRPTRRLPLRRDFEFAPRPETVSSLGGSSSRNSNASNASTSSTGSGGNVPTGPIEQWQMNALVDSLSDDEEIGDVEAALRHLEGQLHPRQKAKASKVDGWVKNIQARAQARDFGDEHPRYSDDEDEGDDEEDVEEDIPTTPEDAGHVSPDHLNVRISIPSATVPGGPAEDENGMETVRTPIPSHQSYNPGLVSPQRSEAAKPAPEAAIPVEILESRLPEPVQSPPRQLVVPKFASGGVPRNVPHRSFIFAYRSEVLAQHFAVIDRELFMGVKFEELVLDDWSACEEVNVYDWTQYLKDRATWKAESRWPEKTTALAAVRARFNLMAGFVVSEVVLAPPSERPHVVAKFLRIAWKSYYLKSFNALVAIIYALKSALVGAAMSKSWNRIPLYEARIYNDLKLWTTSADNFRYIRLAIDTMVDPKPLQGSSHPPSVVSGGNGDAQSGRNKGANDSKTLSPDACIPFIGVYLSQLHQYNHLPDLIDPTAPEEVVSIDSETNNYVAPAHPEVFSTLQPLPPSMTLEPLINVHKQRLIAGVIKSLVAGQHLASHVQFPVDKRLFQKCLRLRSLDYETLHRALNKHVD